MFKWRNFWIVMVGLALASSLYFAIYLYDGAQTNTAFDQGGAQDVSLETPLHPDGEVGASIETLQENSPRLDRLDGSDVSGEGALKFGAQPASVTDIREFVSNGVRQLYLQGAADPNAIVELADRGQNLYKLWADEQGEWRVTLDIQDRAMVISMRTFVGDSDISIRSDETIFRLIVPDSPEFPADGFANPALVMLSAPGGPSRIIQSPFGGVANSGPLALSAIDYDDMGGAIISGTSQVPGRVRLYAGEKVIGETSIDQLGRWAYIAGKMLPHGEWSLRVELISDLNLSLDSELIDEAEPLEPQSVSLSVPFILLPPMTLPEKGGGLLRVSFQPMSWQIRRTLVGGGVQSTIIFSPNISAQMVSKNASTAP